MKGDLIAPPNYYLAAPDGSWVYVEESAYVFPDRDTFEAWAREGRARNPAFASLLLDGHELRPLDDAAVTVLRMLGLEATMIQRQVEGGGFLAAIVRPLAAADA